jgi:hypothetical protein
MQKFKKKHLSFYFPKFTLAFLSTFFSFASLGQDTSSNVFCPDLCGCNLISKIQEDSLLTLEGKGEVISYYSDGTIKYKSTKKNWRKHKIYFYPTGIKCKEEFLNFTTHIKKTIFYDTLEKKQMVCKGRLSF